MNPLKIAASIAVAPSLSLNTVRDVVTLDNTDFTDVAVVVVLLADTRSGVLTLLRQTGFNLPVFVANAFDEDLLKLPGVTGEINGHAARVGCAGAGVRSSALLTRGDLVLFDRNNHKSNHHGALIQAGATPVYLEAARNPFGFIGGIDAHCFDEAYLREQVQKKVAPHRAQEQRPFRLAIIQLGIYDGTVYKRTSGS